MLGMWTSNIYCSQAAGVGAASSILEGLPLNPDHSGQLVSGGGGGEPGRDPGREAGREKIIISAANKTKASAAACCLVQISPRKTRKNVMKDIFTTIS